MIETEAMAGRWGLQSGFHVHFTSLQGCDVITAKVPAARSSAAVLQLVALAGTLLPGARPTDPTRGGWDCLVYLFICFSGNVYWISYFSVSPQMRRAESSSARASKMREDRVTFGTNCNSVELSAASRTRVVERGCYLRAHGVGAV